MTEYLTKLTSCVFIFVLSYDSNKGGADAEQARVTDGITPLFMAAQYGHGAAAELLLLAGANVEARAPANGVSPLWIAAVRGQHRIVEMLLAVGADVNASSDAGSTPLFIASSVGYIDVVSVLLRYGADRLRRCGSTYQTALEVAQRRGHAAVAQRLVFTLH